MDFLDISCLPKINCCPNSLASVCLIFGYNFNYITYNEMLSHEQRCRKHIVMFFESIDRYLQRYGNSNQWSSDLEKIQELLSNPETIDLNIMFSKLKPYETDIKNKVDQIFTEPLVQSNSPASPDTASQDTSASIDSSEPQVLGSRMIDPYGINLSNIWKVLSNRERSKLWILIQLIMASSYLCTSEFNPYLGVGSDNVTDSDISKYIESCKINSDNFTEEQVCQTILSKFLGKDITMDEIADSLNTADSKPTIQNCKEIINNHCSDATKSLFNSIIDKIDSQILNGNVKGDEILSHLKSIGQAMAENFHNNKNINAETLLNDTKGLIGPLLAQAKKL